MRAGSFAVLALWAAAAAAQTTYKCKDERGRVTYSNTTCEKQGLKDAGPVAERTTTMPLGPAPKPAPAKPAADKSAAAKADSELGPMQSPAQVKPVVPLLEKLLK